MRRLSATHTWFVYEAVASFFWTLSFTVAAVFFVLELGLSPLELVLVGTAMELAVFVFEVPTGIVADTYGRKRSVVIGMFVLGGSYVLVGVSTAAVGVIAAYAVWGLGWTFLSGAFDAWLADEVGEERLAGVYHRGAQIDRVAGLLGIGVSVGLAQVDLRLPILVGGAGTIALGVLLLVAMPETGFRPRPREGRGQLARDGGDRPRGRPRRPRPAVPARHPRRSRPSAGCGARRSTGSGRRTSSRTSASRASASSSPSSGSGSSTPAASCWRSRSRSRSASGWSTRARPGPRACSSGLDAFLLVSALVFALAGSLWLAVVAFWATRVARNVAGPVFDTWVQRSIGETDARATVLSITNQADAVGQWTGGPFLGALGNVFGIRAALAAGAFCMAPALWLYGRAARHDGRIEELEADPAVV